MFRSRTPPPQWHGVSSPVTAWGRGGMSESSASPLSPQALLGPLGMGSGAGSCLFPSPAPSLGRDAQMPPLQREAQLAKVSVISSAKGEPGQIASEGDSSQSEILNLRGDGDGRRLQKDTWKECKWCLSCSRYKSLFLENIPPATGYNSYTLLFPEPRLNTQHLSRPGGGEGADSSI